MGTLGETILYTFTGDADGKYPSSGVVRDEAGNLYGITLVGGASNAGVVYMPDASGRFAVLHEFPGGADVGSPYGVIRGPAGDLFGTAGRGGTRGGDVVFSIATQ